MAVAAETVPAGQPDAVRELAIRGHVQRAGHESEVVAGGGGGAGDPIHRDRSGQNGDGSAGARRSRPLPAQPGAGAALLRGVIKTTAELLNWKSKNKSEPRRTKRVFSESCFQGCGCMSALPTMTNQMACPRMTAPAPCMFMGTPKMMAAMLSAPKMHP